MPAFQTAAETRFLWRFRRPAARRYSTTKTYMTPSEALRWALSNDINDLRCVRESMRAV